LALFISFFTPRPSSYDIANLSKLYVLFALVSSFIHLIAFL